MFHYLKLVRLPNLLVVVLTQALVFYHLIKPAFQQNAIHIALKDWQFWSISAACVMVTAAGYIINDILDADGDAVNRPGTNVVHKIGVANCRYFYLSLVLLGFGFCLLLAFSLQQQKLLWLYPVTTGALALYSRYIKPLPLVGNLLVALLCAGVPSLIALAERDGIAELLHLEPFKVRLLIIYICFAFLTTLLRELIKDLEDLKGDIILGRQTLPIVLGKQGASWVAIVLLLVNLLAVISPYIWSWPGFQSWPVLLLLGLISLSLLIVGALLLRARVAMHYGQISSGLKLIMLLGLLMLATF